MKLYYELHGSGEPLAQVHGAWADATAWRFVVPGLAESFRVLSYDRRGHSRSERPASQGVSGQRSRARRAADTVRRMMTIKASPWGRAALGATVVSAVGYATQNALDYVSTPDIVGLLAFYGLFGGFAIAAGVTGVVAVVIGRHRRDHTVRLGLIAIGYVALAQAVLSLRD